MNKETLIIVTGNKGKVREIESITGWPVEAVELEIAEIQHIDVEVVAREKAVAAYKAVGRPVVVDDTGMSISALKGLPGALVAWFLDSLGPAGVLRLVANDPDRRASVSTCIAYTRDGQSVQTFVGTVEGNLTTEMRGSGGFGYDPIFVPEGSDYTYAEMSAEQKNAISMRRIALHKFREFLES